MRKHITRAILGVLAAFTLCSCQSTPYDEEDLLTPDENSQVDFETLEQAFTYREGGDTLNSVYNGHNYSPIEIHDGYLYYANGRTIIQYNPQTNIQMSLCGDPLCKHDELKCPFFGYEDTFRFTVADGSVIYRRSYKYVNESGVLDHINEIVRYDLQQRQLNVLRTLDNNYVVNATDICIGNHHLYVDVLYDDDKANFIYTLCQRDIRRGDIEILFESESMPHYTPLFLYENQIYYANNMDNTICAASADHPENIQAAAQSFGALTIYDGQYYSLQSESGELVVSSSTQSARAISGIEGADYFYMTDQYIYYRKVYDTVTFTSFYGEPVTTSLRAYYRCSHDGQNHELIYREEPLDSDYTIFMGDFVVLGNYIYTTWGRKILTAEEDITTSSAIASTIVRYDIETGDWYYIMNE